MFCGLKLPILYIFEDLGFGDYFGQNVLSPITLDTIQLGYYGLPFK